MTSDMLFLARSEHGLLQLDKHDVDLAAELNELRELFEPLADETGKTITVEGEGVVAGDSDMLRRAFSNLLSNAIKYSPDNTCTAIHLERDSDCVNVMITNTMSGQVPANLERLFDRFYRADSSRFYNTEGAGLGLSITRSIIHAHGGELSAEQQGREIVFSASVNGLIPLFRRNLEGDKIVIVQSRDKQRRFFIISHKSGQRDNSIARFLA